MRFSSGEVAGIVGGELLGADVDIDGVSTDSRHLAAGELFVSPRGPSATDTTFSAQPSKRARPSAWFAATGWLTCRPRGYRWLIVEDTGSALVALSAAARRRHTGRVVAITGSVGKTSTKDLLAAALGSAGLVHASPASFNNAIGVPLTLLGATGAEWALVVEIGTNAPGEIADLAALVRPEVGVVTAVGAAHTAAFGTIDDVAREKGDLVAALPPSGTAVLNADDPPRRRHGDAHRCAGRDLWVRRRRRAGHRRDPRHRTAVGLRPWRHRGGRRLCRLRAAGRHTAHNALAAAAAALMLGADIEAVAAGLGRAELSPWRMAIGTTPSGALVINDA